MGCDNDFALPSCLLAFSAGISVNASFWFYTRRLETLEKGSGRRRSASKSLLSVFLTHSLLKRAGGVG